MSHQDSEDDKVLLSTGKVLNVSTASTESPKHDDSDRVVVDRVRNVWGSSSGAGSDFLDTYRKQRSVEMMRLEEMDKKWREDMENKLFNSQRIYRIKKENDKTMKRKLKREKRKKKIASLKQGGISTDSDPNNSSETVDSNFTHNENDVEGDVRDNLGSSVYNVSDQKTSESNLDLNNDSFENKSRLIIIDKSENDFL